MEDATTGRQPGSPPARAAPCSRRRGVASAERGACSLRPVVEGLGEPAPERARLRRIGEVGRHRPQRLGGPAREGLHGLLRRTPLGDDRLTHADPDPAADPQPAGAVDGQRDDGHARPQREVGRAVRERHQLPLAAVDPPLPRDRDHPPVVEDPRDPAGRLEHVRLGRAVRDPEPGPRDQPVAGPLRHVLLLGAEHGVLGHRGQHREQEQGVRPVEMVEAVDRRPGRESLSPLDAQPEQGVNRERSRTPGRGGHGWAGGRGRPRWAASRAEYAPPPGRRGVPQRGRASGSRSARLPTM